MGESYLIEVASAMWLGILTSISPCPLATNIAAVSFIGKRMDSPRYGFLSGLLYTIGRMLAYLVIGILITRSIFSIPGLSGFLQNYMNKLLGPLLIITGMILLEMIQITLSGRGVSEDTQKRIERTGIWGAGLLGILFALSFCPISAALFFGSLIPLAVKYNSSIIMPSVFGIGTGIPVILFAFLIAFGVHSVGKAFDKMAKIEMYSRKVTGIVFILVGIFLSLKYIFEIL